jgi:hypothetical protein
MIPQYQLTAAWAPALLAWLPPAQRNNGKGVKTASLVFVAWCNCDQKIQKV